MHDPTLDIAQARAAVERLLEELDLRTFLFTLEPKEAGWRLSIECESEGGWQSVALPVDPEELRASLHDSATRERLREAWSQRLGVCQKGRPAS
jgi:hypothetical protein